MSNLGPEAKEVTTAAWDIAGHLYNALVGSAPTVAQTVAEEVKEVVASESILEATKTASTTLVSPVVDALQCAISERPSNMTVLTNALSSYLPEMVNSTLFNATQYLPESVNSTLSDVAKESGSYLPYGITGATVLGGLWGLNKLRGTRQTLQTLMNKDAYGIIGETAEVLTALDVLLKNPAIQQIIKLLTPEQATTLVKNKALLAGLASMSKEAQVLGLNEMLTVAPKVEVSSDLDALDFALTQVGSASSSISATQSASVAKIDLAEKTLVSDAGKQLLAKIRGFEKSNAVLGKMEDKALKFLDSQAGKVVGHTSFPKMNDATLAQFLIGVAAKVGQTIEVEAKKALKF